MNQQRGVGIALVEYVLALGPFFTHRILQVESKNLPQICLYIQKFVLMLGHLRSTPAKSHKNLNYCTMLAA